MGIVSFNWMFSAYPKAREELLRQGQEDFADIHRIEVSAHNGIELIAAKKASIHNDPGPDFDPWSALWILQASRGHKLYVINYQPRVCNDPWIRSYEEGKMNDAAKRLKPETVRLKAGQIVLFNEHKVHWMDGADDDSTMIAAVFTFKRKPKTKNQIEDRIFRELDKEMWEYL